MSSDEGRKGSAWKWVVLVVLLGAGAYLFTRAYSAKGPADPDTLRQDVALKCSETGFEWKLNRGRMEGYLYQMAAEGKLDASTGLENPKTGKRTGFPVDRADWEKTVARILKEGADAAAARSGQQTGEK